MTPMMANTLREWKQACPNTEQDLVFPSERGEILWHTNLYEQCFLALLDACGLLVTAEPAPPPPFNFQRCAIPRRTSSSNRMVVQEGADGMGHSSIHLTFDIYGHLFPTPGDDAKDMTQREARLMGG